SSQTTRNKKRPMWRMGQCWSKKLSYCIAFSAEEVVDVTKRYTRGWPAVLERRNLVDEPILIKYISNLSQKKQTLLDKERRTYLSNRRKKEEEELDQAMRRTFIREDELIGRESGSLEWRINRKEYGDSMKELQGTAQTINNSLPNRSSQLGSIFRLTEDKPAQCGGVFMKQPFDLNSSHVSGLQVEFSFRITNQLGGPAFSGADGFAFVIQTQKEILLGQGGCELGFGGLQSSLAIEFDTYKSSDRCDDPSDNHISIQARLPPHFNSSHHDYSLGHTSQIPSMKSGEWIDAKVTILTKEQHIQVCLREKTPSNNAMEDDYVPVLLEKVLVKDYLHYCSDVIIGFTASTGGLAQNHDIIVTRVILCQQE
ncbi:concanavalin A-like lectin/glucanase domain-containing protein, partial [Spinellus fusiger]